MTRRRTSVIGAPRAAHVMAQAGPEPVPPQVLRQWSAAAVRELVLSPNRDEAQARQRWLATRRRWRIALGSESGNPADSDKRSHLQRLAADAGQVYWRKVFEPGHINCQSNETNVLKYLGEADTDSAEGLRSHFAWMKQYGASDRASRLNEVTTLDAGPNLDMWQDFAAVRGVGPDSLPLPLFAQPLFLAAVVRQALVVLEALARHQVVHGDIKAANFCLALPMGWAARKGTTPGQWDLRNLPLRAIDFELGYAPPVKRKPQVRLEAGVNESPYARACHLAAAASANEHDWSDLLSGIDWGTDLWALGLMLAEWCQQAIDFRTAYVAAFRDHWGVDSDAYAAAGRAVSAEASQLGWLQRFAGQLQAAERPVAEAGRRRLAVRPDKPHRPLWNVLEAQFPKLGPGTGDSTCVFSLIDPESPLAEEAGPSPWLAAAQRLRQQGAVLATGTARASRSALALATRRPRRLVLSALLLGLPSLAWQARGDAQQLGLQLSQRWAPSSLRAFRDSGQGWQAQAGQAGLALAEALQPGQAAAITLAALDDAPAFDDRSPILDPDALHSLRDASLRALTQLARLPAPALAEPAATALAQRLLLAAYHAGTRLETTALVPLGPGTDGAADALARLYQVQGFPLAALLQVQVLACHAPASRIAQAGRPLDALLALPAGTASRSSYLAFAQAVRARIGAGQPACLLHPAQTAN